MGAVGRGVPVTRVSGSASSGSPDGLLPGEVFLRLPAAIAYATGPDLIVAAANEECRRIAGGGDITGQPLSEALPDLPPGLLQAVARVAETGRPCESRESEIWIRRGDHEPEQVFVDFACQPVRDDSGGVGGVLLYGQDATARVGDRRRLEVLADRMAATDDRYQTLFETYRTLLETLPHGVIHCAADGTIVEANRAAGEILGLAPSAMTTWPLDEARRAIHADGSPYQRDELPVMVALRTGVVAADVVAGIPHERTGELRWLRITAVPYGSDERGRPQRIAALLTDITGEHRAEAITRQGRRVLRHLRGSNALGVAVAGEDRVREANDSFRDITGRTRDDIDSGLVAWAAIAPSAQARDALAQLRRTGTWGPHKTVYTHRDGTWVHALLWATVIDWHPLRWSTFVVDLGARRHGARLRATPHAPGQAAHRARERLVFLQRVRQQMASLRQAEQARRELEAGLQQAERIQTIGQLTSGIAHEFGNLLGIIVGYAELAEDLGGDLDPDLRRTLGDIRAAADRAVHLTSDLLRFGRRVRAESRPVDLNALIASMRNLLAMSVGVHTELVLRLSPAALPQVRADPRQLEQVLLNLAVNARDAMAAGGTLTISTSAADFSEETARQHRGVEPGRYAEITVQDTGAGMSPEVRARIFERFFTTKPASKGAGLGLSTVDGIITETGGTIEVDSAEGHGTTFRIYLPAVP